MLPSSKHMGVCISCPARSSSAKQQPLWCMSRSLSLPLPLGSLKKRASHMMQPDCHQRSRNIPLSGSLQALSAQPGWLHRLKNEHTRRRCGHMLAVLLLAFFLLGLAWLGGPECRLAFYNARVYLRYNEEKKGATFLPFVATICREVLTSVTAKGQTGVSHMTMKGSGIYLDQVLAHACQLACCPSCSLPSWPCPAQQAWAQVCLLQCKSLANDE